MRLPLAGGSYEARSIIGGVQRCINYYPEANPRGSVVPTTHYQRPGLTPKLQLHNSEGSDAPVRGLYHASNGRAYAVCGDQVYFIDENWSPTVIGTINPARINPVSMVDNGLQVILADGNMANPSGWIWNIADNSGFQAISDPSWQGAIKVDYLDSFIVWNDLGETRGFKSTLSDQILPIDPLQFAIKSSWPDPISSLIVNRRELILFGPIKSEIWFNAGNPQFPFAEVPGINIEHGIAAPYSLASADISVYWLSQDFQGQGVVLRSRAYTTQRISNHALEFQIRLMYKASKISDAIGYTYQQDGHQFYALTFPTGNQTWVFDETIGEPHMAWHQEAWTDADGALHRHRGNCYGFLHGLNIVGDWENGMLYEMDLDAYTDTVAGVKGPISYVRTLPRIVVAPGPGGRQMDVEGHRLQFSSFALDLECGMAPTDINGEPARISLRWSDDRGRTFGNEVLQSAGEQGQYLTQPLWRGLGIARDRIFEVSHSIAGPAAMNGAWVEAEVLGT